MLCAADHAVDSVAHSFALIGEAGWGEPVSLQPTRTLWSAKLARGGDAQQPLVQGAREVGRVRGVSAEHLRQAIGYILAGPRDHGSRGETSGSTGLHWIPNFDSATLGRLDEHPHAGRGVQRLAGTERWVARWRR